MRHKYRQTGTGDGPAVTSMSIVSRMIIIFLIGLLAGSASTPPATVAADKSTLDKFITTINSSPVLDPDSHFIGSPISDVGLNGLFPVFGPDECEVAVLQGGEDSFAVRMEALRNAKTSIRIQALVFKGDESGLRIAEVLKQKQAAATY